MIDVGMQITAEGEGEGRRVTSAGGQVVTSLWSTGRIAAPIGSQQCYSQSFTLKPGVYYFGDLDNYNLSNFRDVLIVATPGS